MGVNGNTTMTALKRATELNDNRLSAHDFLGSTTSIPDFLIDKIGNRNDGYSTSLERVGSDELLFGETFTIEWDVQKADLFGNGTFEGGKDWVSAIARKAITLESKSNCEVVDWVSSTDLSASSHITVRTRLEVTGFNSLFIDFSLSDGMNTDAKNYNNILTFSTSNVRGSDEFIMGANYDARTFNPNGDDKWEIEMAVELYNPEDHHIYWTWEQTEVQDPDNSDFGEFDEDDKPGNIVETDQGENVVWTYTTLAGGQSAGSTVDIFVEWFDSLGGTELDSETFSVVLGEEGYDEASDDT